MALHTFQARKHCEAILLKLKSEFERKRCIASTRLERRRFRRHVFCQQHQLKQHFVLEAMSALNLATKMLPDTKHALAFLGIEKPAYVMLKTAAAVALSNNRKKFEISREKRGKRIESSTVVAFRKLQVNIPS